MESKEDLGKNFLLKRLVSGENINLSNDSNNVITVLSEGVHVITRTVTFHDSSVLVFDERSNTVISIPRTQLIFFLVDEKKEVNKDDDNSNK